MNTSSIGNSRDEGQPRREPASLYDGAAWAQFCDALKFAGSIVTSPNAPDSPLDRAEGYRYITRIMRAALEAFVEHADPLAPSLRRVVHETIKMGADNPDNYYQHAAISGAEEYRIRGQRGSVFYLGFYTQVGHYGQGAGMPPTGFIEAKDMHVNDDGTFEIIVSARRHEGNWLPMTNETGTLIVRQTFLDRANEQLADFRIERIGATSSASPFEPAQFVARLQESGKLVAGAAMLFANWSHSFKKHTNELPMFDPNVSNKVGGDPNIIYYHSYWELAPDEALVIEATPPECDYWNFQLNNYWMESLDYRHYPIHVNKHTAHYRPDGSVQVVVAHRNAGFENWIDTVNHRCGTMCWRWVRAKTHPQPRTRVIKLDGFTAADVREALR